MKSMLHTAYTLLLAIVQVVVDGFRVFAVDSLRQGAVDLRPLEKSGRILVLVALAIVGAFILSLLFSDVLRVNGALQPLRISSSAARGFTVPAIAVPITSVAMTLAWSYILTGAVSTRRLSRWLCFALFTLFGVVALTHGMINGLINSIMQPVVVLLMILVTFGAFALLLAIYAVLPHTRWPLAVRFAAITALVTLILLPSAMQTMLSGGRVDSVGFNDADVLNMALVVTRALLFPFLLIAGVEMYNFAQSVSTWLAHSTQRHAPARMTLALLLAALGLRALGLAQSLAGTPVLSWPWAGWTGAALLMAGVAVVWGWMRHKPAVGAAGAATFGLIVVLILVQVAPHLTLFPAQYLGLLLLMLYAGVTMNLDALQRVANGMTAATDSVMTFYSANAPLGIALLCGLIGLLALRRGRPALASFAAVMAWGAAVRWLTRLGGPLAQLHFDYSHLDAWLVVLLIGATAWLLARGEMTQDRAVRLLGITILTALLNQTGFLDNPFSPLFSAGGVLLLVIGIVWGVLTAGVRFLNADSADFPRMSRALMYFGYVMLSLCVAHWFVVSHDVEQQMRQSDITLVGFVLYGLALFLWLLVMRGRPLLEE